MASLTDLSEAFASGQKAVSLAEEGNTAVMVVMRRVSDSPYEIVYESAPIAGIANIARSVPTEWINARGNDIEQPLYDYLRPLIAGEVTLSYINGIPDYMEVTHLKPGIVPAHKNEC